MTFRDVAQQFGDQLVRENYGAAWELLTPEAKATQTPAGIQAAVASMTAYAPGPIQAAQVVEEGLVEDWPEKQPGDVAVVYVALTGIGCSEAVIVTVVQHGADFLIRQLAWGRP